MLDVRDKLRVSPAILEKYGNMVNTQTDIFGDKFIADYRPVAGKSAAKSGQLFEDITEEIIKNNPDIRGITKQPIFYCHFGLKRRGDFECVYKDTIVSIECKQLGNAESHFDKLSHVFMNLVSGCYGKNFWLVYDYNLNAKPSTLKKIDVLEKRCLEIKKQVALQGITFEYLTLGRLQDI